MTKRSFESINYSLRPNKNVERKLIVSSLQRISESFPIRDYRYIGFGSMWFTDFILMHKNLGISDMVTIEAQKSRKKRVEFNKPFSCIRPVMEKAVNVLGDVIDQKNSIVWLDFDGPLKNVLDGSIDVAVGAMISGSMILVTINAVADQLRDHKKDDGSEIPPLDYLVDVCDGQEIDGAENRLSRNEFPSLVAEIVHARIESAVLTSLPDCEYIPIWSFGYADGAEMVTVGGMIANEQDRARLAECNLASLNFLSPEKLFQIELPNLTDKEKRALDKLLPSKKSISPSELDFELKEAEVSSYQAFYLYYPMFNELAI